VQSKVYVYDISEVGDW